MANFPPMLIQVGAFIADTYHLDANETGHYFLTLMTMWRSPDCRLLISKYPLDKYVAEMFDEENGYWVPGWYSSRHIDWNGHPCRLLNSTWRKIRNAFLSSQPLICAYCGTTSPSTWEVDHIRPRARGGTHAWDNLAVSCRTCNLTKGTR